MTKALRWSVPSKLFDGSFRDHIAMKLHYLAPFIVDVASLLHALLFWFRCVRYMTIYDGSVIPQRIIHLGG